MTIAEQNANQIREPFALSVSMTGLSDTVLTYAETGTPKLDDELRQTYPMRALMDFAGPGFLLDGSCEPYNPSTPEGEDTGKLGYRSNIGEGVIVTVSTGAAFASLAIFATGCEIIYNGVTYTGSEGIFTIPVGANTATLDFTPLSATERIEIQYIRAGISVSFTNENLVRVHLALRSDLTRVNPTWQVSEIEINAYWPDDIQEAVANINDDIPIVYSSGYPGDMSPARNFYLSEAEAERNLVTLKGVDASYRLTESLITPALLNVPDNKVYRNLYSRLAKVITDAGITFISRQAAPPASVSDENVEPWYIAGIDRARFVSNAISLWHVDGDGFGGDDFYPVFVDAGRPVLRWSKPAPKWTIEEEDCAEVINVYDRMIARIRVPNMFVYEDETREVIGTQKVKRNRIYTVNMSQPYYSYTVSNGTILESCPTYIRFRAAATGDATIRGKKIWFFDAEENEQPNYTVVTRPRTGITETVDTEQYSGFLEQIYDGLGFPLIEYGAQHVLNMSEKRGSFRWKGHPKMQPRDVFNYVHLDGTTEVCTIETIELTHEGGGTYADISYRTGVV